MTYSWDDIRFFLAVAEGGSLSAAARGLGTTQPTVGRHINSLEERTGLRLFDRMPDGFRLTDAGADLLVVARKMAEAASEFSLRQAGLTELNGSLRLSSNHQCASLLVQLMPALLQEFPKVDFTLLASQRDANLSQREADILIRFCIPEFGDLVARKLGEMDFAIYAARDFVTRQPDCVTDHRYEMRDWVHFDDEHITEPGEKWLAHNLKSGSVLRVSNLALLLSSLRTGMGMGLLPCYLGDGDPTLMRVSATIPEARQTLHLLVHRDLRKVPLIRKSMDTLINRFGENDRLLRGEIVSVQAAE